MTARKQRKVTRARANAQAEQTALERARAAARWRVLEGGLTERGVTGYVRGWLMADKRLRGKSG